MGGATIYSSMTADIGTLGPTEIPVELVAEADSPGQATVYFTAKKPGNTIPIFKSTVNTKWVRADSDETVTSLGKNVQAKEAPGKKSSRCQPIYSVVAHFHPLWCQTDMMSLWELA